jgi:hypothetical protein
MLHPRCVASNSSAMQVDGFARLVDACFGVASAAHALHGGIPIPGFAHRLLALGGARSVQVVSATQCRGVAAAPVGIARLHLSCVSDAAVRPMAELLLSHAATLTAVSVASFGDIVPQFGAALSKLPHLTELDVSYCNVGDFDGLARGLSALPRLRQLDVSGAHGIAHADLALGLSRLRLSRLGLACMDLHGEGVRLIATALAGMGTVRQLLIYGTDMQAADGASVAAAIAASPHLRLLDVFGNELAHGWLAVVGALGARTTLTAVDLSETIMTTAAAHGVGAALGRLHQLRDFSMISETSDVGAIVLGGLRHCAALRRVHISCPDGPCNSTNVGRALNDCRGVQRLRLTGGRDVESLLDALTCLSLRELTLSDCNVTPRLLDAIIPHRCYDLRSFTIGAVFPANCWAALGTCVPLLPELRALVLRKPTVRAVETAAFFDAIGGAPKLTYVRVRLPGEANREVRDDVSKRGNWRFGLI